MRCGCFYQPLFFIAFLNFSAFVCSKVFKVVKSVRKMVLNNFISNHLCSIRLWRMSIERVNKLSIVIVQTLWIGKIRNKKKGDGLYPSLFSITFLERVKKLSIVILQNLWIKWIWNQNIFVCLCRYHCISGRNAPPSNYWVVVVSMRHYFLLLSWTFQHLKSQNPWEKLFKAYLCKITYVAFRYDACELED